MTTPSYEMTGRLKSIGEAQTFGNNGFTKLEFVIMVTGGKVRTFDYPVKFELHKERIGMIEKYREGEDITVSFDIRGNESQRNGQVYNALIAWKIERVGEDRRATRSREEFSRPPEREPRSSSAGSTYRGKNAYQPPRDGSDDEIDF